METVGIILQDVLALGIYNVWLVRPGKPTLWRGGTARTLKEEFQVYGLPVWVMGAVGFLKLGLATLLLVGLWVPPVVRPAAIGMAVLMLGAISMHLKVKDPLERSAPAFAMFLFSVIVALA